MSLGEPIRFVDIEYKAQNVTVRIATDLVTLRPPEEFKEDAKKYEDKTREIYETFAYAIIASLGTHEPKKNILSFIKTFGINPKIQDLDIRKHDFAVEAYSVSIVNNKDGSVITMIKFLNEVLTDEIFEKYLKSRAGTNAVIMQNSEG